MPAVANVIPIRRALSSTLREAIDLYHQTFSDVTVVVTRLEKIGLSLPQVRACPAALARVYSRTHTLPHSHFFSCERHVGIVDTTVCRVCFRVDTTVCRVCFRAQFSIAFLLIVMGFTTYFLVPLAFVTGNFVIFLSILSSILLGMLLGLTLISQALQVTVELHCAPFSHSLDSWCFHLPSPSLLKKKVTQCIYKCMHFS